MAQTRTPRLTEPELGGQASPASSTLRGLYGSRRGAVASVDGWAVLLAHRLTSPQAREEGKRRRVWIVTEEKERMEAQKALRERMTAVQRFFDENGGPGNPDLTQDEKRDSWKLVEQLHVATNRWLELNR